MMGTAAISAQAPGAAGVLAKSSNKDCSVKNLSTKKKFDDLQTAVDRADPGVSLQVKGSCSVRELSISKDLTLVGKHKTNSMASAVIDGGSHGTVIVIAADAHVTLQGFLTVTGGANPDGNGGGLSVSGHATLDTSVIVTGNSAQNGGGVYVAPGGSLTANNGTQITHNTAETGGGISLGGAMFQSDPGSLATIEDGAWISDNTATYGGAMNIDGYNGNAAIGAAVIAGNKAHEDGGGLYVNDYGGAQLTDTLVSGNSAKQGGGAYVAFWGVLTLTDATVRGNEASIYGGGIYTDGALVFDGSTVTDNSAGVAGGGYYWAKVPATNISILLPTITGNDPDDVYPVYPSP